MIQGTSTIVPITKHDHNSTAQKRVFFDPCALFLNVAVNVGLSYLFTKQSDELSPNIPKWKN
jgi:hypothetical protein